MSIRETRELWKLAIFVYLTYPLAWWPQILFIDFRHVNLMTISRADRNL